MTIYKIYFPLQRRSIYLVDRDEKRGETYIECDQYISRSGLTYNLCFEYDTRVKEWVERPGIVPISTKILEFIKEGLWHHATGKVPPKEFSNHREELEFADKLLRNIYDESELEYLLLLLANGFHVYIKREYDIEKLVAIDTLTRQGNLEIWKIEFWSNKQKERIYEKIRKIEDVHVLQVSSHVLTNAHFTVIAERKTRYVEAKLVHIGWMWDDRGLIMPLTLLHPEHEKVEVEYESGLYLLLHVKTPSIE